jgi:hypothetical protein
MQLQHALQILLEMVLGRQTICWNFLFLARAVVGFGFASNNGRRIGVVGSFISVWSVVSENMCR